jgi:hypothetical protein
MYKIEFKIPNTILLKTSEIMSWFQKDGSSYKHAINENKDILQIKNFYLNFYSKIKDKSLKEKFKKGLCYV